MPQNFSAVILAGGRGTRMGETQKSTPKYLREVSGKTLLLRHIEHLDSHGFSNVTILVNDRSHIVDEYLKKIKEKCRIKIDLLKDNNFSGTAGALFNYLEIAKEEHILVTYADTLHNVNLTSLMNAHISKNADYSSVVHPNAHPVDSDQVICDDNNRFVHLFPKDAEKPHDLRNFCLAAMLCIRKNWLMNLKNYLNLESGTEIDLTKDILFKLDLARSRCYAYITSEYIKDAGTPTRLEEVSQDLIWNFAFKQESRPAVFFDRDGTLNYERGLITDPNEIELIPGAAKLLHFLNELGVLCILVTNQPVIARGECTPSKLESIHARLEKLLLNEGAILNAIYYCPHHPESGFQGEKIQYKIECECRKPKIGLLKKASLEHNIDSTLCWFVGNSEADKYAARNFGINYFHIDFEDTLNNQRAKKRFQEIEDILRKELK